MPRALEPSQTFPLWLDGDAEKPEGKRPTFYFRSISVREWKQVRDSFVSSESDAWDATLAMIKGSLTGWSNMIDPQTGEEIPYSPDDLDKLLDFPEAAELLDKLRLGPKDKKKLG